MTATARRLGDHLLAHSPLQFYARWRSARRLAVLAYHGIQEPATFARQLDYLITHMRPVRLDEWLVAMTGGPPLPERAVLLTFDDGERSVLEVGLPLLQERGLGGVVFVVAGHVGSTLPFWWEEVKQLVRRGGQAEELAGATPEEAVRRLKQVDDARRLAALASLRRSVGAPLPDARHLAPVELRALEAGGLEVGNHTLSHPCLNRCSPQKARDEIVQSHARLTEWLGHPPRVFAYPNGDRHPDAEPVLAELGYEAAFLFDHRLERPLPAYRFCVSRLRVNSTTSLDRFRMIISGLHPALHHARGGR